jgi:hypothetical protein
VQLSTYLSPPPLPARPANESGLREPAGPRRLRPSAAIVPLPQGRGRPRKARPDESRGEILLFLGVRYERRAC